MVKLKEIWIEQGNGRERAIRLDWDNDQHQRIEIEDDSPKAVAHALKIAGSFVANVMVQE